MKCDLTISETFQAYYDCRKTKRNTWNALKFEENLERNLMNLYRELVNNTYSPGRSIMFVVTKPKAREVWAANFKDRIVHHILYNRYSKQFYNSFIFDSYACIPGKGTLKAAKRLQHFIRSVTKNNTTKACYLKADIANFFVSIDKKILEDLLSKKITDPWWLKLTRIILHNDPTTDVYIKSSKIMLKNVPQHKSLLNAPKGFGLPIGNLSSQFFANVYLDVLDQYAKHELKLKYYMRYVDDIVVLKEDTKDLNIKYEKMSKFVNKHLGIKFHPNKKEINKIEHGINFVGYIIKTYSLYMRRYTIQNMYFNTNEKDFHTLRPTINSYLGMLGHTNSFSERVKITNFLKQKGVQFDSNLTKMKGEQHVYSFNTGR